MIKIHHNPDNEHPYSATIDVMMIDSRGVVTCTITGMAHTEATAVSNLNSLAADIYGKALELLTNKKQYVDMYGHKIEKK